MLVEKFIKNSKNVKDPKVRDAYGKAAGIVGIISNLILCAMKMAVGLLSGSIAIVADAVNNLADASSSIITLIGFKLASLPENEEHPYGHARIEYLAGLIVSIIIIIVGVELGKSSVQKILNPEPLEVSLAVIIVLVLSIAIKFWQSRFNISIGKKINSMTLIATGTDSRNDVISTTAVLIATVVSLFIPFPIDGYMGVLVALFIIWSGIGLVKETVSPLLGEAPDPEVVNQIHDLAMSYDGVLGIHDLIVYDYGPGKIFASIHIEVDSKGDIMESHDLVDTIEYDIKNKLGIMITGHMDPIDLDNPDRQPIIDIITDEIQKKSEDGVIGFHDLRFVAGPTHTNVIFDVVLSPECKLDRKVITEDIAAAIKAYKKHFATVINYDISFVRTKSK